jgi:hypothetical protein
VLKALESPIRQIAENSGAEGSIVVGKVSEHKSQTWGFNAQTEEYVDMIEAGIVDPAREERVACNLRSPPQTSEIAAIEIPSPFFPDNEALSSKDPTVVACLRFTLSYRDVEDLLAESRVDVPIKRGDGS